MTIAEIKYSESMFTRKEVDEERLKFTNPEDWVFL